jgi:hypothetical protein
MSLMVAVVVDANVLIAARLSRDQNHERGEAIAQAMDRGTLPTAYVLSDVLEEIINYLQARAGHDVASKLPYPTSVTPYRVRSLRVGL